MPEVKGLPATPDRSLSRSPCSLMTNVFTLFPRASGVGAPGFAGFAADKQEER